MHGGTPRPTQTCERDSSPLAGMLLFSERVRWGKVNQAVAEIQQSLRITEPLGPVVTYTLGQADRVSVTLSFGLGATAERLGERGGERQKGASLFPYLQERSKQGGMPMQRLSTCMVQSCREATREGQSARQSGAGGGEEITERGERCDDEELRRCSVFSSVFTFCYSFVSQVRLKGCVRTEDEVPTCVGLDAEVDTEVGRCSTSARLGSDSAVTLTDLGPEHTLVGGLTSSACASAVTTRRSGRSFAHRAEP